MKTSERLRARLADELGLRVETPERIPRGKHGRSGGTFAWIARRSPGTGAGEIGSEDTMTDCVNAGRLGSYRCSVTGTLCIVADD